MAEQLWTRNEFPEQQVGLWVYYDDSTPESVMTRFVYRNPTTSEALLEIFLQDGTRIQETLPAQKNAEVFPRPNKAPALDGVRTHFTWPANPMVQGRR